MFFANSRADASGFISFNYTRILTSRSSHTFERVAFTPIIPGSEVSRDLNGEGVVDEKDVVIVFLYKLAAWAYVGCQIIYLLIFIILETIKDYSYGVTPVT